MEVIPAVYAQCKCLGLDGVNPLWIQVISFALAQVGIANFRADDAIPAPTKTQVLKYAVVVGEIVTVSGMIACCCVTILGGTEVASHEEVVELIGIDIIAD